MHKTILTGLLAGMLAATAAAQGSKCDFGQTITTGCNADGTGYVIISGLDPDAYFEIYWNGNEANGGPQLDGLENGKYWVNIFDGLDCEIIANFTIDCPPPGDDPGPGSDEGPCQFRTQTQGGWGSPANGNNPGAYRDAHFAQAFPNGLMIGCGNRRLRLTSAAAVRSFLPSGSSARILNPGTMVDPGNSYRNVLAGQLVALTLSVGFDAVDPTFGASNTPLGNAYLNSGPFQGWTAQDLLNEANHFIGGCGSIFSAAQINTALSMVNESSVDGTTHTGAIGCTHPGTPKMLESPESSMLLHPNPASNLLQVHLHADRNGPAILMIRDAMGRVAMDRRVVPMQTGEYTMVLDVGGLANGTYFVELHLHGQRTVQRVIVAH